MKTMITKLAAVVSRMKASIAHAADAYEKVIKDLGDMSDYPMMYDFYEMV